MAQKWMLSRNFFSRVLIGGEPISSEPILEVKKIDAEKIGSVCFYILAVSDAMNMVQAHIKNEELIKEMDQGKIVVGTMIQIADYSIEPGEIALQERILVINKAQILDKKQVENPPGANPIPRPLFATKFLQKCFVDAGGIVVDGKEAVIPPPAKKKARKNSESDTSSPSSLVAESYTTLQQLTLQSVDPILHVRVLRSNLVYTKNQKQMLILDLQDGTTACIRAVVWGAYAAEVAQIASRGQVLRLSKFRLRAANPDFNKFAHPCELSLTERSKIETLASDSLPLSWKDIKTDPLVPLSTLASISLDQEVNVLAVVARVLPLERMICKNQVPTNKRTLVLVDHTNTAIFVHLWRQEAENIPETRMRLALFIGFQLTEWNGQRSLNARGNNQIYWDPPCHITPEVIPGLHELDAWQKQLSAEELEDILTTKSLSGPIREFKQQTLEQFCLDKSNNNTAAEVQATVRLFRPLPEQTDLCMATCLVCKNNKPLLTPQQISLEKQKEPWWCDACQKGYTQCNWNFAFVLSLSDSSLTSEVRVGGRTVAQQLLKGKTTPEWKIMSEEAKRDWLSTCENITYITRLKRGSGGIIEVVGLHPIIGG